MCADLTTQEMTDKLYGYLHWYGVATFLRCAHQPDLKDTDIGLIGFPCSGGNPVERMQYLGPRAVRNRSAGYNRNLRSFGINPFEILRVRDIGDVPLGDFLNPDKTAESAEAFYRKVHEAGIIPITVGGDHSITTPILRGIAGKDSKHGGPIGMIHFDAHADTFVPIFGTKHHAGAAFRLGVEEGLIDPKRTIQIGLHGPIATLQQDDWSHDNLSVITLAEFVEKGIQWTADEIRRVVGDGPTYLSVDIDVLDVAYAPGVTDPEVDGMTTRELFGLLNKLRGMDIVGADFACYCPPLDNPAQITALTISELMLHVVTHIAERKLKAS